MNSTITVNVNFPALDRLIEYFEGKDQARVDDLVEQVGTLTDALRKSQAGLKTSVDSNKEN